MALARIVGTYAFGTYAIITGIATLAFNVFDFRLQEQLIYFHSQVGKHANIPREAVGATFAIDLVARFAGLAAAIIAGLLTAWTLNLTIGVGTIVLAGSANFLTKAASAPAMGYLRVRERQNFFVVSQLSDWAMRLISLLFLATTTEVSLANVLITQCACAVTANVFVLVQAGREYFCEYDVHLVSDTLAAPIVVRDHWRKLAANQGISVADSVVKEADTVIVGYLLSIDASGLYKMAKNFASIAWRAADPIFIVIMPVLSKFWAERAYDELSDFIRRTTVVLGFGAVLLYGLSCAAVVVAVTMVLGPDYRPSEMIYPIAAAWILIGMPLIWTHPLAMAAGRPGLQTWASLAGNLAGLATLFVGTSFFGLWGAALGLSVAYALPFLMAAILLRKAGIFSWKQ